MLSLLNNNSHKALKPFDCSVLPSGSFSIPVNSPLGLDSITFKYKTAGLFWKYLEVNPEVEEVQRFWASLMNQPFLKIVTSFLMLSREILTS